MYSKNFLLSQKHVENICLNAHKLVEAKRFAEAENLLINTLGQFPDDANVLFSLGSVYQCSGRMTLAIQMYKRTLLMAPNAVAIYNNLGGCYHKEGHDEAALEYYTRGNTIAPNEIDVLSNLAGMYVNSGNPGSGFKYIDKALELQPDRATCRWNKSLLCLESEDYEEGFKLYEAGIETGDRKYKPYYNGDKLVPEWDGQPCDTLIICGEQGIGDEIMFSSIISDVSHLVRRIVFDCHPRLIEIFKLHVAAKNCEFIVSPSRKQVSVNFSEYNPSARVNVGSLGKFFRNSKDSFPREPFLLKDDKLVSYYKDLVHSHSDDKPIIGISWFGGAKTTRSDLRSIPLEQMVPLFATIDAHWVNLQYNVSRVALNQYYENTHNKIYHYASEDDYYNWCMLANSCDVIVTVCTSMAHIAGAYGIPAYCLVPKRCAWRYGLKADRMVWYDSVKLLRQSKDDEWSDVIIKLIEELKVDENIHR